MSNNSVCGDGTIFGEGARLTKISPGVNITVQPNSVGVVEYDHQKRWVNDQQQDRYGYDALDGTMFPLVPEHIIPYTPQQPAPQEEMPQLIEEFKKMLEQSRSNTSKHSNFSLYREENYQIVTLSLAGVNPDDITVSQAKRDFIIEYKMIKQGKVTNKKEVWKAEADDLLYNEAYVTYEYGMLSIMIPVEPKGSCQPKRLEIKRVKK